MKIRLGFVSNSSSSSFMIRKELLSPFQIHQIENHLEFAIMQGWDCGCMDAEDSWTIASYDDEKLLGGYVSMDNFSMYEFFKNIGVSDDIVEWEY